MLMLACKVELSEMAIPFIHDEHPGDEVFGLLRRICKLWLIKVPLGGQNVVEGLVVIIAKERRETAQANRKRLEFFLNKSACRHLQALRCSLTACMWWRQGSTCLFWTTQNRSWWPRERGTLVCRNSPAASPVVYICERDFHVNPTMEDSGYHPLEHTHTLARPKSMILILLVSLLTQRMFSGWN